MAVIRLTPTEAETFCADCYFPGGRFEPQMETPVDGVTKIVEVDCGSPRCGM